MIGNSSALIFLIWCSKDPIFFPTMITGELVYVALALIMVSESGTFFIISLFSHIFMKAYYTEEIFRH